MRSLLQGTRGRPRVARARWILDLVELRELCRPSRSWVTPDEWTSVWFRARRWNGQWEIARRAVFRLQAELRELGVALEVETPERERGMRIHVDTPAIASLIDQDVLVARRITERVSAEREGREPEAIVEPPIPVKDVALAYAHKKTPLTWLSRRYGSHHSVLRKILVAARQRIGPRGRRRIEDVRPVEVVERALRAWDAGAGAKKVARILTCSRRAARNFLARHFRSRPSPGDPQAREE